MLAKLSGYKTYIFTALLCAEQIAKGLGLLVKIDPGVLTIIETVLGGSSLMSLRAGVKKAQNASEDATDAADEATKAAKGA